MSERPTIREQAIAGARQGLCTLRFTDGFCGGEKPDCRHCAALGQGVAIDVLRRIRPTLQRLLLEIGTPITVTEVMGLIDEAIG